MNNHNNDTDESEHASSGTLISRRALLKTIAGAPLVVTFGLAASPLMRFLKPTMKPGAFFQAADMPVASAPQIFNTSDFAGDWNWLPFELTMKYRTFGPEQYETRNTPGLLIHIGTGQFVAYSRKCPNQHNHLLQYAISSDKRCCGCGSPKGNCGCIAVKSKTPILYCARDGSVFDLNDNGRVLVGPASKSPSRFTVVVSGELIRITGLDQGGIA